MRRLDNLTLRSRMIAALAVVVTLTAALGAFSWSQLQTLTDLTTALYEHPLRVSNAALRASLGVTKMNLLMEVFTSPIQKLTEQEALTALQEEERRVYENLDVVRDQILGAQGQALEREARELFARWKPLRQEILSLRGRGDRQAAAILRAEAGWPYAERVERKMLELTAYARRRADGFMVDAAAVQARTKATLIGLVTAAALLAAVLLHVILRSILRSVSSIKSTMSEIATTGRLAKADLSGSDEIAEMARHFNALIDALQRQFWLKEGLNALHAALSGPLSGEELARRGLQFVARHVEGCAGALYAWDAAEEDFGLLAPYALGEGEYLARSFRFGEGLVGQVAAERRPILLDHITPAQAVAVSGTVREPPRTLYALPLVHGDQLQGVLEVGSFEAIDDTRREFLDAAGAILATALYSAHQAERVAGLLKATQAGNEALRIKTAELNAANEEMVAANDELHAQAEELRAQTAEMEAQQAQLQEADRLKSEFLSNMSHELRTPLNSVLALSQLMISRGVGKNPKQEEEYLRVVERNGRQLLSLINDILDLSKIESGRMDVFLTEFDPLRVAQGVVDTVDPMARAKALSLVLQPGGAGPLRSDESKVQQILLNLVSNAVKFTDRGRVEVAVTELSGRILFSVRDTGIGIEGKDLAYIFDEFRQVDGSTTRRHEGTGLGLAICQKLAHLLGGRISVESTPGQGSTFTLALPFRPAPPRAVTSPGTRGDGSAGALGYVPKPVDRSLLLSRLEELSPERRVRRLLVVDDDPAVRETLSATLGERGYRVETASGGAEGLALARQHPPDALILDLMMPEVDGFTVLERLREDPAARDLPVIVLTAKDLTAGERERLGCFAQRVMDKGEAGPDRVVDRLEGTLASLLVPNRRAAREGASPRVLVVEDNPVAALQIRSALEENGYGVELACGGAEALERVGAAVPDAIVLDLMMPGVDGFQVLEEIRSVPSTADLPVLVLTAKELTAADRARLTHHDVQELVQKGSLDRDQLVARVRRVLESREAPAPPEEGPRPPAAPLEAGRGRRGRILVAEDNPDNRFTIEALLDDLGYEHETADDGEKAVLAARRLPPALILLDMHLPVLSGLDAARRIKADPALQEVPIVALTARAMRGDREEILAAGCDDYLSKPLDPAVLASTLCKWMG